MDSRVAGDLTFGESLRLGAGCSIEVTDSTVRGFEGFVLKSFIADPAVQLLFAGYAGGLVVEDGAAFPTGAALVLRQSAIAGLSFVSYGGTIDIDASNVLSPPASSTYISVEFRSPSNGNSIVLRGSDVPAGTNVDGSCLGGDDVGKLSF